VKNQTPQSFLKIAAVFGLALVLAGCPSDPTEVSLDDLTGVLEMHLTSQVDGGGSASSLGFAAPLVDAQTPPTVNEIGVPSPGTGSVLSWPVVAERNITPRFSGHDIILSWAPIDDWPCFDILAPEHCYFGHSGMIYFSRGRGQWSAIPTEWMRRGRENTGTYYPYEEKFVEGSMRDGDPIGFFVAGPWRHQSDREEYRRRTNVTWYTWPSLTPLNWPDPAGGGGAGGGGGPVTPEVEPNVQQIHVFITTVRTQLAGGTIVEIPNATLGDIDLLAIRGQSYSVSSTLVPAGTYSWVDFILDSAQSYLVVDGETTEMNIELTSIRVGGPFVVGPSVTTTVTIEFDPDSSLTRNDDGTYTLNVVAVLSTS